MSTRKSVIALTISVVIVLLVYAPIVLGGPKGWSLYAYWTGLGGASLAVAGVFGWTLGGDRE